MAFRRLGQTADASSEVTLFTFDGVVSFSCTVRSLIVTNRSGTAATIRVSHNPLGAATTTADYWFYDTPIIPNQALVFPLDCGMSPTDSIKVLASSANVTFNLYGEL